MRLFDADLLKGIPIKDKLERNYQTFNLDDAYEEGWFDAIETIEKQPTVDAEPIRHGHWKDVQNYYDDVYYECSACGEPWVLIDGTPSDNNMNYCPNCGALMDEEVKE